ncbi:MAG: glycoside hydrolase family 10 protein [bacterium]
MAKSIKQSAAAKPTEVRAIWVWGYTVHEEGAEKVVENLVKYKFNTVILLIKGGAGEFSFKSSVAQNTSNKRDILQEMITACHKRGIAVHAWFMFHGDKRWVDSHPDEAAYKAGDTAKWAAGPVPAASEKVCPLAPGYREYFKQLVGDVLDNYAVDGIHLDGIRYTHINYCFCPRHQQKAKELGINLDHLRTLVHDSLFVKDMAKGAYVEAYKNGDPDVVRWVDQRDDEITSMTNEIKELILKKKPTVKLSAALMPEGGEAYDGFALCYYGQNYRRLGRSLDFICPMSYEGSFGKKSDWVVDIAKRAEAETGKPVYAGIQGFTAEGNAKPFTAAGFKATLQAIRKNQIPGFVIFRYGSMTDGMLKALK